MPRNMSKALGSYKPPTHGIAQWLEFVKKIDLDPQSLIKTVKFLLSIKLVVMLLIAN